MADPITPSEEKPKLRAVPSPDKPKAEGKAAPTKPRGRPRSLKDRIQEFIASIGMAVSIFNFQDGATILESSEELAESWANLAAQNAKVRENIERILTGGAWSAVIMAHGSVAVRIAQNHDLFDNLPLPGNKPPQEEPPPPAASDGSNNAAH